MLLSISSKISTNKPLIYIIIFLPSLSRISICAKALEISNIIASLLYLASMTPAINEDSLATAGIDTTSLGIHSLYAL